MKSEQNVELHANDGIDIHRSSLAAESKDVTRHEQVLSVPSEINRAENIPVDNETDLDCVNKSKQLGYEKATKKETCRTRRFSMFKRVTSMENLKNYKERQRRYIKKSVKRDANDGECYAKVRNVRASITDETFEYEYKCAKCDRLYSSKKSLDRHTLTHTEKKFKCDDCDKEFFCLEKLLKHVNLHKTKEKSKPVSCRICNKSFRKTDTMVRHLNVHKKANPKEVFCILKEIRDKRRSENILEPSDESHNIVTGKNAGTATDDGKSRSKYDGTTRELRKRNVRAEHRDSDLLNSDSSNDRFEPSSDASYYHCEHCGKRYSSERALQRHVLAHDERKYVCNVCNMKFFRQDRLKSHQDRYGHDESKVCSEPQKPPDDKSAIKLINSWIREELDSDNEGKGFPCKLCGKSYDTKKSLLKHQVNAHETKRSAYCANCGEVCRCASGNDRAEKVGSPSQKSKPYTCEECNKSFEKEIKLQRHLRIHERAKEQQDANFKRFLCHICSKTFRQNTGLMFHMRTHTGYKPHVCKYCGRGFTSNSNCINHERTHTGDRPFVCQYCSAAFAKSCTLKAHITTHTGEANYHCKTCGKSFRRLKYLKEHRFTHTGEKPYACKICGTAYSHSGSLFVHEKKCKAQYNNYQSGVAQNLQPTVYGQSAAQIVNAGVSVASPPVVTPVINAMPQAQLSVVNSTLNMQAAKNYVDSVQRGSVAHAASATLASSDLHSNADITEMSSPVKNFTIIGQMFHM